MSSFDNAVRAKDSTKPIFYTVLVAAFILSGFAFLLYVEVKDYIYQTTFEAFRSDTVQAADRIKSEIELIRRQVSFMHGLPPISGIVRATKNNGTDSLDHTHLPQWKTRLQKIFTEFLRSNNHIRQARFIGVANNGLELVRVDKVDGDTRVVPEPQLQSKGERNYFRDVASVPPHTIYISDIELNREHGIIEDPAWPTIRGVRGVYDERGQLFGAIVINYDANYLLDIVRNLGLDGKKYLLNQNGDFLVHPNRQIEFAFESTQPVTWQQEMNGPLPQATADFWQVTNRGDDTIYYTAAPVVLGLAHSPRLIMVVCSTTKDELNARLFKQLVLVLVILGILISGLIGIAWTFRSVLLSQSYEHESGEYFKSIVENSVDAIVAVDHNGEVKIWNKAAHLLIGYKNEEVLGKVLSKFLVKDQYRSFANKMIDNSLLRGEVVAQINMPCQNSSGEDINISMSASPIYSQTSTITGVVLKLSSAERVNEF